MAVVAAVVATWQQLDADLAGARVNGATRWPSGFDWRAAGARPVPVCLA